jgi:fused signal recognition particle receptor
MLGQNSFQQVKSFSEAVKLDSVIFTKLDGSAKGGVVFAIAKNFELPISYITISENNLNGIKKFVAQEYVERLFDGA